MIKGKWPTNKRDEFGPVGLTVTTRCSFCDASHKGHRDKGKEWFEKHMRTKHKKILRIQKDTPSAIKKPRGGFKHGYKK